jgi:hypothetical protein
MTPYIITLSVHVVVAVLGLGQIAGMLVLAHATDGPDGPVPRKALERLVRGIRWSLVLMFLTGALIEYLGGGLFHDSWWFRTSFVLLLVIGAINGWMGRLLRRLDSAATAPILVRLRRGAWAMCTVLATITFLMEAKPG